MNRYDVAVVGAGHAGIEAALASARLGFRTLCVTLDLRRAGHLPCNCSIGGPAKGHLAREIDALGGQMGITSDKAATHIRRVGTGKGPAVQTVRLHVCKTLYPSLQLATLESQSNLDLVEGEVTDLHFGDRVEGITIRTSNGHVDVATYSVVLTTGTFLNGLCHIGDVKTEAARHGDPSVTDLPSVIQNLGIRLRRFKTGTTPRIRLGSIDFTRTEEMPSETDAGAISYLHDRLPVAEGLYSCFRTQTSLETGDLIRANLSSSALFGGHIQGVGPRYCPSIEDKIVRFANKPTHPVFLEREHWNGDSVYVQGFSTSLPEDLQLEALRTVSGLEDCEMIRPGYAVEYDMADPTQLWPSLMSRKLNGLFLAGQINGTSGYEEAAAQGLVAGINATRWCRGETPVEFPRETSFVGVMIDDLVTKGVDDPYRMLTARAEHRLILRHDNADQRLTPLAKEIGLCSDDRWERFVGKRNRIQADRARLESVFVHRGQNHLMGAVGLSPVEQRTTFFELLQRPGTDLCKLESLAQAVGLELDLSVDPKVREQVELAGKYRGYIELQSKTAEQTRKLGSMTIPDTFDFEGVKGLSYESIEKLSRMRPSTVGQASRIPGVRPPDIALLIGHIRAWSR